LERQITLRVIDELWADYLARLEDFKAGIPWQAYAAVPGFFVGTDYRDPHFTFLRQIDEWFPELEDAIPEEIARRLADAEARGSVELGDRGAVWTYLTTDQPFGSWTERVLKGIRRKMLGQ
jgi:preprotein translocase subunit SecA